MSRPGFSGWENNQTIKYPSLRNLIMLPGRDTVVCESCRLPAQVWPQPGDIQQTIKHSCWTWPRHKHTKTTVRMYGLGTDYALPSWGQRWEVRTMLRDLSMVLKPHKAIVQSFSVLYILLWFAVQKQRDVRKTRCWETKWAHLHTKLMPECERRGFSIWGF